MCKFEYNSISTFSLRLKRMQRKDDLLMKILLGWLYLWHVRKARLEVILNYLLLFSTNISIYPRPGGCWAAGLGGGPGSIFQPVSSLGDSRDWGNFLHTAPHTPRLLQNIVTPARVKGSKCYNSEQWKYYKQL